MKDDSGPAFPTTERDWDPSTDPGQWVLGEVVEGISKLDYFAGKALQGICASGPSTHFTAPKIAAQAYTLADAMMAERNKRDKP